MNKETIKKMPMPKVLRMSNIKNSAELGAWLAGVMITSSTLMLLFNYAVGKINDYRMRKQQEKMMAKFHEQMAAQSENLTEADEDEKAD